MFSKYKNKNYCVSQFLSGSKGAVATSILSGSKLREESIIRFNTLHRVSYKVIIYKYNSKV